MKDRFRLKYCVGRGAFGSVYASEDLQTSREVAVKLQSNPAKGHLSEREIEVYQQVNGAVGFPKVHLSGVENDRYYVVMDLLGKSLRVLLRENEKKFSLKTTLMLMDQMLQRVQYLHLKGIIHRDLKPSNFLMGLGSASNQVHLIDFGLCLRLGVENGVKATNQWQDFAGTPMFASVRSMSGCPVSQRDDMEALGYIAIYMLTGTLPWKGAGMKGDGKALFNAILATKSTTVPSVLCEGLPDEFRIYMEEVKALNYAEVPDYAGYRKMFRKLLMSQGMIADNRFDWVAKVNRHLSFTFQPFQNVKDERLAHESQVKYASKFSRGGNSQETVRERKVKMVVPWGQNSLGKVAEKK